MKVKDLIQQSNEPFLSLEFVPPLRGSTIEEITKVLDDLIDFSPAFINITNHPVNVEYVETKEGIVRMPVSRRPGTIGMAAALKYRYENVEVVPHLTCIGQSKYQLEETLIELNFLGIRNVFVIRGDIGKKKVERDPDEWIYAKDLVKQIANMNRGEYLYSFKESTPTDFCIGVAGYPEKHYESLNIHEDLLGLKEKIEAGADYVITQMFFDVDVYLKFVEMVREIGISVPVIPGIKPVTSLRSLRNIPKRFFVDIPPKLVESLEAARSPEEERKNGTAYMIELFEELLKRGVPGVHVFTMSNGKATKELLNGVFGKRVKR